VQIDTVRVVSTERQGFQEKTKGNDIGNCLSGIFNKLDFNQIILSDGQIRQRPKSVFFLNKQQRGVFYFL